MPGDVGSVASEVNRAATWGSRFAGAAEERIGTGDPVHTGSVGGVGARPRRRQYDIDTNLVDNVILPTCIRKKTGYWLLIGRLDAALRSAVICSLLITAPRYGVDPAAW
jgi:hypothetical protein